MPALPDRKVTLHLGHTGVSHNPFGDEGIAAILSNPTLMSLEAFEAIGCGAEAQTARDVSSTALWQAASPPTGGQLLRTDCGAAAVEHRRTSARDRDGDFIRPEKPDVETAVAWQERKLVFKYTPLEDIAVEFNRYNTAKLRLENVPAAKRLQSAWVLGVFKQRAGANAMPKMGSRGSSRTCLAVDVSRRSTQQRLCG